MTGLTLYQPEVNEHVAKRSLYPTNCATFDDNSAVKANGFEIDYGESDVDIS